MLFLLFLPTLVFGSPVLDPGAGQTSEDNISVDPSLLNFCALPPSLDYQGFGKPVFDCDTMSRYKSPPCYNYGFGGSYPKICCPKPPAIKFPGEPGTPSFVPTPEYEEIQKQLPTDEEFCAENVGFFDYTNPDDVSVFVTTEEPALSSERCNQIAGTNCRLASECGAADFGNSTPPIFCGADENSGENKFCCSTSNSGKVDTTPQKPRFLLENTNRPWPCEDLTSECSKWLQSDPDVCEPNHISFGFTRFGCMKTCNICGDQGCVDNYSNCPKWARSGVCSTAPEFMIFNCRESCGTCGYKSSFSKGGQLVNGREYSDMNSPQFFCGSSKSKKAISGSAKNETYNFGTKSVAAQCTSTIISDKFILSAAHCTQEFQNEDQTRSVKIRDDSPFAEIIEVRRHFVHPLYEFNKVQYDLVIFELERRIEFDFDKYGDSPTCLNNNYEIGEVEALSQGFGITENGTQPNVLLEAKVLTISNEECIAMSKNTRNAPGDTKITEGVLCTKGIKNEETGIYSGPCEGDSGGPLYINTKTLPDGQIEGQTLAGIHQGGVGCGSENNVKYWQRVSSYLPWIKCVKENAEKNLSHRDVERACNQYVKRFS